MNKPRFTKQRFHKMCDMAEVSEQLVADYMNGKSSNSSYSSQMGWHSQEKEQEGKIQTGQRRQRRSPQPVLCSDGEEEGLLLLRQDQSRVHWLQ